MKGTILIVDDTEDTRLLLKTALDLEGYTTISVPDGKVAINFLENFKPDLIIADLMMPEVSGVELIKHLRNQPVYVDIPIIAISGFLSYIEEAKQAGATGVLQKPVNILELPQIISQLLAPTDVTYH